MSKTITLIDSDSLAYLGKTDDTLQQIIEKVDYKIQAILDETKADYYCLFVSKGQYFRHSLKDKSEESGSYKSNRAYTNQNYNKVIKEYLITKYNAVSYTNAEADDIICWMMNKEFKILDSIYTDNKQFGILDSNFTSISIPLDLTKSIGEKPNLILAAIDKDLLKSIPGRHLNYNKKISENEWGLEWIETSKEDADNFKKGQLIIGDSSDGILGIPKKGEKYWEKMISNKENEFSNILNEYILFYGQSQGIYEFQKNYRLLHLLETDEDWLREVGYIPKFPEFNKVIKSNIEIKSEF